MDTINYQGGTGRRESTMESVDWRTQFDSRPQIVNKMLESLKQLPHYKPEKLQELKSAVMTLEEKIYSTATSHEDYLRKISLKLMRMESRSGNHMPISLQSDPVGFAGGGATIKEERIPPTAPKRSLQSTSSPTPKKKKSSTYEPVLVEDDPFENLDSAGVMKKMDSLFHLAISRILKDKEDSVKLLKAKLQQTEANLYDKEKVLSMKERELSAKMKEMEEVSTQGRSSAAKSILQVKLMMADDVEKGAQASWEVDKWRSSLKKLCGENEDVGETGSSKDAGKKEWQNPDGGVEDAAT